jgi:hypothetical protein
VDAISIAVTGAIAARLGEAFEGGTARDMGELVGWLFVAPRDGSHGTGPRRTSRVSHTPEGERP